MRNFVDMSDNRVIINAAEAAEILGIATRTVLNRITAGTLEADKLPGKTGSYVLDRAYVERVRDAEADKASA